MTERFQLADDGHFYVNLDVQRHFDQHGFIVVRALLNEVEVDKVTKFVENSVDIAENCYGRGDGEGRVSRLCIWNCAGDDITGLVARSRKVSATMERLLGGDELYHYHSKLMMKEAHTGGQWNWHQDYGYWYNNGCLSPHMGSVFIALDKCVEANGCLRVVPGSHKLGRLDHVLQGDQAGVEPQRLQLVLKHFRSQLVELDEGDAIFFHSNLIHTSGPNVSSLRRYAMIVSLNARHNDPVLTQHHSMYHQLNMVDDDQVAKADHDQVSSLHKDYLRPHNDISHSKLDRP